MMQMTPKREAGRVLAILEQVHGDARIALNFSNPL